MENTPNLTANTPIPTELSVEENTAPIEDTLKPSSDVKDRLDELCTHKSYIKIIPKGLTEEEATCVEKKIITKSRTIKNMIDDLGEDDIAPIPLPNIDKITLEKIIEYFVYRDKHPCVQPKTNTISQQEPMRELDEWEKEYCPNDYKTLFNMILAANFLDMGDLLAVLCKDVANKIECMSTQEIRTLFNIANDFAPEEEKIIIKENNWVEKW